MVGSSDGVRRKYKTCAAIMSNSLVAVGTVKLIIVKNILQLYHTTIEILKILSVIFMMLYLSRFSHCILTSYTKRYWVYVESAKHALQ